MSDISVPQIKKIRTLISKLNLGDMKEDLVFGVSSGRTTSTSKLNSQEAFRLISHLSKNNSGAPSLSSTNEHRAKSDKMRKQIISCAHEMGMKLPDGKINMNAVNRLVAEKGYLKDKYKTLDEYTYNDLPKLVFQFKQFRDFYLKKK
jgi:hypothetical protein